MAAGLRQVLRRLVAGLGASPGAPAAPRADIRELRTLQEFRAWRRDGAGALAAREQAGEALVPPGGGAFDVPGYCVACGTQRRFAVQCDDGGAINWRESLVCHHCGLNNRMRAALDLFRRHLDRGDGAAIYLTEQLTPLYDWARRRYPGVIGSEYLGADLPGGTVVDSVRHEDLTALSFASDSLDCVLSLDVLEHIPDYRAALRELARCLRPGGVLLLSVPFTAGRQETLVRARVDDAGGVEHLLPPEYHGNPTLPGEGALCFYHFGWDLLDEMRAAGFATATVQAYDSPDSGNLGKPQLFLLARSQHPGQGATARPS